MSSAANTRPFTTFTVVFLTLIALVHLLRAAFGWTLVIEGWAMPTWWSGAVAIPLFFLALMVWRESKG